MVNVGRYAPHTEDPLEGFDTVERVGSSGRYAKPLTVAVYRNGGVYVSAGSMRALNGATHARLMVDRDGFRIALAPTTAEDPNGYKLHRGTDGKRGGGYIHAQGALFAAGYDAEAAGTRKYAAGLVGDALVFALDKAYRAKDA